MDVLLSWPGIAAIVLATVATTLAAVRLVRWIRRRRRQDEPDWDDDWADEASALSLSRRFDRLTVILLDRLEYETERRARKDREARDAELQGLREDVAAQLRTLRHDLAWEREEQASGERAARRAEQGEWLEALDRKLAAWAARPRGRDDDAAPKVEAEIAALSLQLGQIREVLHVLDRDTQDLLRHEAERHALREDMAAELRALREDLEREREEQALVERATRQAERAEWLEALDRRLAQGTAPPAEQGDSDEAGYSVIRLAPPREPEADEYRVWFATNRRLAYPNDPTRGYSSARDRIVRHGYCDVYVPESHRIGSVGSSALRRLLSGTDDRLRLRAIVKMEVDAYWAAVARQLAEAEPGERHAVVFIHGYNVSFEEAAIRAAQIGFDLGIGTMAFFSWPSKGSGSRRAYQSDGQSIGASEGAIADYLVDFAQRSGAEAVHVIVHSMGNQGVLRAMNRIVADAQRRGACRFGQLILAAADVDADTFGELAGAYRELAARTTLYVSGRDLALKASAWFADYPRVGLYPPVSVFDGIDTVSVSNIDLTLLGHGYVGGARDVLQDMHRLIFTGEAPPRFGLRPRTNEEGRAYWEVGA